MPYLRAGARYKKRVLSPSRFENPKDRTEMSELLSSMALPAKAKIKSSRTSNEVQYCIGKIIRDHPH